jgi:uncharacterized protein
MKIGPLPRQLDLRNLAARGVEISGVVSPTEVTRLLAAGMALAEPARAQFRFSRDEEARYVVEAHIQASVLMQCQRCLGEMRQALETRSRMACVWRDEDAADLPADYEPLICGESADLGEIAEDEILLALPVSPLHADDCATAEQLAALKAQGDAGKMAEPAEQKANPFAVLGQLKS